MKRMVVNINVLDMLPIQLVYFVFIRNTLYFARLFTSKYASSKLSSGVFILV